MTSVLALTALVAILMTEEADLDELTALLPLRLIDARVLRSCRAADGTFTVYELEVHTTRGAAKRHRRFREFLTAHDALVALLRNDCDGDAAAPILPELAKSWSSNSPAVAARRVKELNGWLEAAVLAVHGARTRVDSPSEQPHELLQVFLCRADAARPSDVPAVKQGGGGATVGSTPVGAASVTALATRGDQPSKPLPPTLSPSTDVTKQPGGGGAATNVTKQPGGGGAAAVAATRATCMRSDPLAEIQLEPVQWADEELRPAQRNRPAAASPEPPSDLMASEPPDEEASTERDREGESARETEATPSAAPSESLSGAVGHSSRDDADIQRGQRRRKGVRRFAQEGQREGQSGGEREPSQASGVELPSTPVDGTHPDQDSERVWNRRLAIAAVAAVVLAAVWSGSGAYRSVG